MSEPQNIHTSVLLYETIDLIEPSSGIYIDCTLGLGGHTEAILDRSESSTVIGIDQDLEAIEKAKRRLQRFGDRFRAIHANFSEIGEVIKEKVDGIIADLGVSSLQFDSETRGFSFRFDSPLDMRMDASSDVPTAADLLATLSQEEIANIIYQFGEERFSRRIARRIVEKRERGEPVKTTRELVELVERSVPRNPKLKIHPATRTFQALRIAVNDELGILEKFLTDAVDLLKTDGRLAVITFHSLEDRVVKQTFAKLSGKCSCPPRIPQCVCGAVKAVEILTKKPISPSDEEIIKNPRSRSAKLRGVRKLH
ncbi:MAG TPA: 16S rRNA (cytosine(1402)-N(4))-methyltransferase RsmH [Pyrinomonadaceae bacterium]|nr:16S rRNA (cytosine(1402)-N(4))-methyltransferase RsmH [Pyrinomonadaceae bacterium]